MPADDTRQLHPVPRAVLSLSIMVSEVMEINEAAHAENVTRAQFIRDAALVRARRVIRKNRTLEPTEAA